ncbi:MAG: GAF domain-containing protein, partial [Okeania sp. SIO3H1]|nr:GAF domain-containing protein [Okeania sp. SIO3H1]
HRLFCLIEFGIALFVVGFLLLTTTGNFIFDKFIHYGALLFVFSFYLFSAIFPQHTQLTIRWLLGTIPLLVFACAIVPLNLIVESVSVVDGVLHPQHGPMIAPYALMFCSYIIASLVRLVLNYRISSGTHRTQIQYFFLGIGVFILLTLLCNALLPAFGVTDFILVGPLASILASVVMTYAIIKHSFLDIRVVIQRTLIYSTLFSFIVLSYITALRVIEATLSLDSTTTDFLGGLVATIIGISTIPRLDRWLRQKTDQWLFVGTYNYREALHELSTILHSSLQMDRLLERCSQKLEELLRAEAVQIRPERSKPETEAVLTIPVTLQRKRIGTITLGAKKSGAAYTPDDMTLLETFANQAATAISRIFLYQEIKQKAEELEQKVIERTAELATAYNHQSEMMLQISHNLQTPLAIMQTKLDGLPEKERNSMDIESFEQTLHQVSTFVQQLLRLARLEHGETENLTLEDCNVTELLTEIAEEAVVIADMEEVTIEHTIDPNLTTITDTQHLREVIMNLLSNGIKYIGAGRKRVSLSATQINDQITIKISDTGLGISPKALESIFDRFYRAGESQSAAKGTGLGLAITKRLVTSIGGTITATSTLGVGSEFTVNIPVSISKRL